MFKQAKLTCIPTLENSFLLCFDPRMYLNHMSEVLLHLYKSKDYYRIVSGTREASKNNQLVLSIHNVKSFVFID